MRHSCRAKKGKVYRDVGDLVSGLLVLWAALAGTALSEVSQPSLRAFVDQSTITIGDVLNLRVEVSHTDGMKVQFPSFSGKLGPWTVRNVNHSTVPGKPPGWSTDVYEIQLAIYRTGDSEIPAFDVELLDSNGRMEKVSSSAIPIKVKSVLSGSDETLRDLKPQAEIPPDYKPFLLTVIAILAGLTLIYQVIRHFRKGKQAATKTVLDRRSAEEIVREAISRLLAKRLVERGLYKAFYLEISEIVKRYLGSRLGILSLELTSEEFMRDLGTTVLPSGQTDLIRHFLTGCDLVKFAKYHPSEEEVKDIVETAYTIVETTERELTPSVTAIEVSNR